MGIGIVFAEMLSGEPGQKVSAFWQRPQSLITIQVAMPLHFLRLHALLHGDMADFSSQRRSERNNITGKITRESSLCLAIACEKILDAERGGPWWSQWDKPGSIMKTIVRYYISIIKVSECIIRAA